MGDATPNYDANGNLTWDGRWAYAYDRENRLVQAANDQMTLHYRYDAFNRLVERSVGGAVVRYYYDDRWRLVAEYDGAGNLLAKYVYGPEIDEPVRMTRGGAHYYYHAAALGTVTEITDASGNLVERYSYDVYGEPTIYDAQSSILSISSAGNRLLFQGRDLDPDTGLYNFRNRYYGPRWGRFVQVDPIRLLTLWSSKFTPAEILNSYAFVNNRPSERIDPAGLSIFTPKPQKPGCDSFPDFNKCATECCNDHDRCYEEHGCRAWWSWPLTFSCLISRVSACVRCNDAVVQCLIGAFLLPECWSL